MENRFEKHKFIVIPVFLVVSYFIIEIILSSLQFLKYTDSIKPYYVTPILRPLVRMFVAEDFYPRTLSMYEWPWDYKTDRARPGRYNSPEDPKFPAYTINSFGLRGKEFSIPKPAGVYRVVVYGGSSTFGSESPDDKTYPAQLEEILQKRTGKKNIEVINYGAHSKSLYWIAQQYFKDGNRLQPDLVIINNIRNTFNDQIQKWTVYTDVVTPQKARLLKANLYLTDNSLLYRFLRRSLEIATMKINIQPLMKTKEDKDLAFAGMMKRVLPGFYDRTYPDMIESIYLDAKNHGSRFMLIVEPIRCVSGVDGSSGPTCMFGDFTDEVPAYYDAFRGAIKKLVAKHPDICLLDPVNLMKEMADKQGPHQNIFHDQLHLDPPGNTVLADLIASKIISENILPK